MSFCSRLIYFNPNKSLPKYRKANCCKKAFLHISSKASYTLEMAVVLPLVAAFFVSILFFFRVLQVQTQVQAALNYASSAFVSSCDCGGVFSEGIETVCGVSEICGTICSRSVTSYVEYGGTGDHALCRLYDSTSDCFVSDKRRAYHPKECQPKVDGGS